MLDTIRSIEETVRFGKERGFEHGRVRGAEQAALAVMKDMLIDVLSVRGLAVSESHEQTIGREADPETVRAWVRCACCATDTSEALAAVPLRALTPRDERGRAATDFDRGARVRRIDRIRSADR